jgi:adenylate kinase family enzyme
MSDDSSQVVRVVVFGNSGSGKSTYAKALANRERVSHLDLDTIVWEPKEIAVLKPAEAIRASLEAFIAANTDWVIEGCYDELVEAAASRASELVFLNPGVDACLANNARRPWEPHKYASLEEQNSMLTSLQAWVAGYYQRHDQWSYAAHRRIFDAHQGRKVEYTAGIALVLEHSVDAEVNSAFAWRFRTDVANWNDPPATFAMNGPFVKGARGTTVLPGQEPMTWWVRDLHKEHSFVIEMPLKNAILSFEWQFSARSDDVTRITQRIVLAGPNAAAYTRHVDGAFGATLADGMNRIATQMADAARALRLEEHSSER